VPAPDFSPGRPDVSRGRKQSHETRPFGPEVRFSHHSGETPAFDGSGL
jgi:hypothetical protein